jgi:hypothetical protein
MQEISSSSSYRVIIGAQTAFQNARHFRRYSRLDLILRAECRRLETLERTTREDLDEIEDWTDRAARRMYEGAGLGPKDVDIFNPYDGYAPMTQFFLEAFQWHGVKRGDAFAFYAGNIATSGSRDRTRSLRAAAIWETGAPVRPCTPTA